MILYREVIPYTLHPERTNTPSVIQYAYCLNCIHNMWQSNRVQANTIAHLSKVYAFYLRDLFAKNSYSACIKTHGQFLETPSQSPMQSAAEK
ncbi:hypothetical protein C8R11_1109 [Nitrosomonas aestuarii]|nr:hypothetical protein C8R11_1109 [Nitrosomonas aestuarii]